jgi:ribosomal RNA-processing protein 17
VISFLHLVCDLFDGWIYLLLLKGIKTYENDDLKVTVVTSEINPEEESYPSVAKEAAVSLDSVVADKRQAIPINNKKPFKKVAKHKSRPKPRSKRDKKKGKKRGKK